MSAPRAVPPTKPHMTERELQKAVIDLAHTYKWRVHHQKPGLTRGGAWLTLVQGDVGFPDLVLCRPPRLLLVELKADRGRMSEEQFSWITAIRACSVECELWHPKEWLDGTIEARLR